MVRGGHIAISLLLHYLHIVITVAPTSVIGGYIYCGRIRHHFESTDVRETRWYGHAKPGGKQGLPSEKRTWPGTAGQAHIGARRRGASMEDNTPTPLRGHEQANRTSTNQHNSGQPFTDGGQTVSVLEDGQIVEPETPGARGVETKFVRTHEADQGQYTLVQLTRFDGEDALLGDYGWGSRYIHYAVVSRQDAANVAGTDPWSLARRHPADWFSNSIAADLMKALDMGEIEWGDLTDGHCLNAADVIALRARLGIREVVPREYLELVEDADHGKVYECPRCYSRVTEYCDCPTCGWAGMCQPEFGDSDREAVTDGGAVPVCPYCASAKISPRNGSDTWGRGDAADDWKCEADGCLRSFSEPAYRQPEDGAGQELSLSAVGQAALDADPGDLVTDGGRLQCEYCDGTALVYELRSDRGPVARCIPCLAVEQGQEAISRPPAVYDSAEDDRLQRDRKKARDWYRVLARIADDRPVVAREPDSIDALRDGTRSFLTNIMGDDAHRPPSELVDGDLPAGPLLTVNGGGADE